MRIIIRRQWGNWQLYTSRPVTLGCKPWAHNAVYHIQLSRLKTLEDRAMWLKHISEKPASYDYAGFRLAIETLLKEGVLR